uniref:PH domain-containing protein n=1 Tax=Panagrellus redivivus TaxID=6233 RepID=A0A7E4VFD7_PANRE
MESEDTFAEWAAGLKDYLVMTDDHMTEQRKFPQIANCLKLLFFYQCHCNSVESLFVVLFITSPFHEPHI